MRIDDLPDFAKPYKTKGYDVRKRGNSYVLFKISSHRVKDKKYPVLKQEYIGVIDKQKGLIKANNSKRVDINNLVEIGFSNIVMKNFFPLIRKANFNNRNNELLKLSIVYYTFGSIDERVLALSHLTCNSSSYVTLANRVKEEKLKKMASIVDKILKERIKDENDLSFIFNYSKMILKDKNETIDSEIIYPDSLKEVLDKYELKY